MQALVWTAPLEAELRTVPVPVAGPGEVVVSVRAVGVCGSDLHGYRGLSPVRTPPLVLGHEAVGSDSEGALHVINPLIGCGVCAPCRDGHPNICPSRGLLGLDRPGAFAEQVLVPRQNLLPLPSALTPTQGTLVEPLATSVNALSDIPIDADTIAVVLGSGPIGLLAAHLLQVRGAGQVICHDIDAGRVAHAAGVADRAEMTLDGVRDAVAHAAGGLGAAVVVDAVGTADSWAAAIELSRAGGRVLSIGLGQANASVAIGDIVRREIAIRGVYAYTPRDFEAALEVLADSPPLWDWVKECALDDGVATLAALADRRGPVKAVFVFDEVPA